MEQWSANSSEQLKMLLSAFIFVTVSESEITPKHCLEKVFAFLSWCVLLCFWDVLGSFFKFGGSNPATCPLLRAYSLPRRAEFTDLKLSLQSSVGVGSGEAVVTFSPTTSSCTYWECFRLEFGCASNKKSRFKIQTLSLLICLKRVRKDESEKGWVIPGHVLVRINFLQLLN